MSEGSCLVVGGSFPVLGITKPVAFCLYGRALNIEKKQWFGKLLFHTRIVIFIWLFLGACFERDLLVENDFSKLTRGYNNTDVYLQSLCVLVQTEVSLGPAHLTNLCRHTSHWVTNSGRRNERW